MSSQCDASRIPRGTPLLTHWYATKKKKKNIPFFRLLTLLIGTIRATDGDCLRCIVRYPPPRLAVLARHQCCTSDRCVALCSTTLLDLLTCRIVAPASRPDSIQLCVLYVALGIAALRAYSFTSHPIKSGFFFLLTCDALTDQCDASTTLSSMKAMSLTLPLARFFFSSSASLFLVSGLSH